MNQSSDAPAAPPNKWILPLPGPDGADTRLRLFCFPQAGSGAWVYQDWHKHLPADVQVMPVELPGRNSRIREPKPGSMGELVGPLLEGLAPLLLAGGGPPFAFFGHSLGAWVAWAAAQELMARGGPLPVALYVSGVRAPTLAGPEHDVDAVTMHTLAPTPFWAAMERRYGPNPDLADPGVRAFVYPLLQADFKVSETYRPGPLPPLPCPLVALGGADDPRFSPQQLAAWQACAAPGRCRVRWFAGSHGYLFKEEESKREFLDFMAAELSRRQPEAATAAAAGSGAAGQGPAPSAAQSCAGGGGGEGEGAHAASATAPVATAAPPAMSRVRRNVTAAGAAAPPEAGSPRWEAPPPQRHCLDCVFCSWRH